MDNFCIVKLHTSHPNNKNIWINVDVPYTVGYAMLMFNNIRSQNLERMRRMDLHHMITHSPIQSMKCIVYWSITTVKKVQLN